MILEGIVTTISPEGELNIAPMGPTVEPPRLTLRPFRTSHTYRNLKAHGEGVFHVTDDVLLLAKAALGPVDPMPEVTRANTILGYILDGACRHYEFRVRSIDDSSDRVTIEAEVTESRGGRDFFGFNRAKHAVLEAAILATRTSFLPLDEISAEFAKLDIIITKTGGPSEREAFELLRDHLRREQSRPANACRVTTGSRLHMGLLSAPGSARSFGGVGLMIDEPAIVVCARRAEKWSATGPSSARALDVVRGFSEQPVDVTVEQCPPEHVGLGVGTQLALAAATAAAQVLGIPTPSPTALGRGARSGLGVHGFRHGGFLIDGGKGPGTTLAPLISRHPFPDDWAILLVTPPGPRGLSGDRERAAFTQVGVDPAATEALCRLALLDMTPALLEHDLAAFGDALFEFNRRAGLLFQKSQGGPYGSPGAEEMIETLRRHGLRGAGQSSWGPTLFAVGERDHLDSVAKAVDGTVTAVRNRGASVVRE